LRVYQNLGHYFRVSTTLKQIEQRMIRGLLKGLGQRAQVLPEAVGLAVMKEAFDFEMRALPDWNGADKQASPFCR